MEINSSGKPLRMKNSYITDKVDLLNEIDNVSVTLDFPVAIVRPAEGEAWDLCLKVLVPGYDELTLESEGEHF